MGDLEDALRRLQHRLAEAGQVGTSEGLFELRAATVVANELMAALARGDFVAADFHADLLDRQVRDVPRGMFEID